MREYNFYAEVCGVWDGTVRAKNKKEAEKKAEEEIRMEGLYPAGEITIEHVPKEDK